VLLIKPSSLGDVATAVPVLRALRRQFPAAHLSWMLSSGCAPLLAGDGDLDEIVLFERRKLGAWWRSAAAGGQLVRFLDGLRRGRYDWVIDLQGLLRSGLFALATGAPLRAGFADAREGASAFYTHRCRPRQRHTIDRNIAVARMLGVEAARADLTLAVSDEGRRFAEEFRREAGAAGGYYVCVPPTRWASKLYPPRRWRQVVAALARRLPVAVVGTASDAALCRQVADASPAARDLAGRTSIPQLVGLIAASAAVVCSDSAAQFIAAAVGRPAVVLVGPTRVERTGPCAGGRAVVAPLPCRGCLRRRCRHITCMEAIDPGEVVAAVERLPAT